MRFLICAAMSASVVFFTFGCGDDDGGDEDAGAGDSGPSPDTGPAEDAGPEEDAGPPVDTGPGDAGPPPMPRTLPTNGSAIAINPAGDLLVAANRTANVVSFFTVDSAASPPVLMRTATLAVPDGEPWAAVWSNEGDIAYVVLRRAQQVLKIIDTRGTPTISILRADTGSEPTGIAISPTGATLYVPNWVDGTVTEISTIDMSVTRTVDLNPALAATGSLGTVTARPALAHPRAIVVTNDGDGEDIDETVYVTEYFSQARTSGVPDDDSAFDVGRQGMVYRYAAGSGEVATPIPLAPVADTGFADSTMAATGCFPNQLYGATLQGRKLYVTAVCESPRGPTGPIVDSATGLATNVANIKTQIHTGIFVVDTLTNAEVPAERVLLTSAFQAHYDAMMRMDNGASRRIPLIALDLAFLPTSNVAYVPGYGSDALFRVSWNADGSFMGVGSTLNDFIDLGGAASGSGRLPVGIALASGGTHAFVLNEHTRNVSVVDLSSQAVVAVAAAADMPEAGTPEDRINLGRRFFVTGLGRWSLRGQAWNSCETCHGDGLTDNVTWFFARGPRQSTSLDGTFDSADPTQQRLLNWTAIFDETHDFELNTRGNSGGVGAIVHATSSPAVVADRIIFDGTTPPMGAMATATVQAGLTGSTRSLMPDGTTMPTSVLDDWHAIESYVRSIRSPRGATNVAAADADAGRTLFGTANCAGCHGTPMWTISRVFYTPNETNNGSTVGRLITMPYIAPSAFPAAVNPPTNNVARSATLRLSPFNAGNDQINCILRAVGTFPAMLDAMQTGVTPAGAPRVREVRANMMAAAQGATGFNPPSLLGTSTGAPYFHAGNARTLEELLSATFAGHHTAFSATFTASETEVRQLTAFLISIDEATAPIPVPATLGFDPELCPDTF